MQIYLRFMRRHHTVSRGDVKWVASCTAGVLIAMMNEDVDPAYADYYTTIRLLLSAGF